MPNPDRSRALDHVVVVMFENRPSTICSAEDGASRGHVSYGAAPDMSTPDPDPREEYQMQRGAA